MLACVTVPTLTPLEVATSMSSAIETDGVMLPSLPPLPYLGEVDGDNSSGLDVEKDVARMDVKTRIAKMGVSYTATDSSSKLSPSSSASSVSNGQGPYSLPYASAAITFIPSATLYQPLHQQQLMQSTFHHHHQQQQAPPPHSTQQQALAPYYFIPASAAPPASGELQSSLHTTNQRIDDLHRKLDSLAVTAHADPENLVPNISALLRQFTALRTENESKSEKLQALMDEHRRTLAEKEQWMSKYTDEVRDRTTMVERLVEGFRKDCLRLEGRLTEAIDQEAKYLQEIATLQQNQRRVAYEQALSEEVETERRELEQQRTLNTELAKQSSLLQFELQRKQVDMDRLTVECKRLRQLMEESAATTVDRSRVQTSVQQFFQRLCVDCAEEALGRRETTAFLGHVRHRIMDQLRSLDIRSESAFALPTLGSSLSMSSSSAAASTSPTRLISASRPRSPSPSPSPPASLLSSTVMKAAPTPALPSPTKTAPLDLTFKKILLDADAASITTSMYETAAESSLDGSDGEDDDDESLSDSSDEGAMSEDDQEDRAVVVITATADNNDTPLAADDRKERAADQTTIQQLLVADDDHNDDDHDDDDRGPIGNAVIVASVTGEMPSLPELTSDGDDSTVVTTRVPANESNDPPSIIEAHDHRPSLISDDDTMTSVPDASRTSSSSLSSPSSTTMNGTPTTASPAVIRPPAPAPVLATDLSPTIVSPTLSLPRKSLFDHSDDDGGDERTVPTKPTPLTTAQRKSLFDDEGDDDDDGDDDDQAVKNRHGGGGKGSASSSSSSSSQRRGLFGGDSDDDPEQQDGWLQHPSSRALGASSSRITVHSSSSKSITVMASSSSLASSTAAAAAAAVTSVVDTDPLQVHRQKEGSD